MNDITKETKNFIENFDQKAINVAFIIVSGKAGSILLHSLLDGHPETLSFPKVTSFYNDFELFGHLLPNVEAFLNMFFSKGSITKEWNNNNFEELDLKLGLIKIYLLEILPNLEINRRNFILAFYFAYAKVFSIDLSKIKCLLIHNHYIKPNPNLSKHDYKTSLNNLFSLEVNLFIQAKEDFKKIKFLNSTRDPLESIYSFIASSYFAKKYIYPYTFLFLVHFWFFSYFHIYQQIIHKKIIPLEDFKFVYFEELHTNTKVLMQDIAKFIGITYSDKLLQSTFLNKPWFGNNPEKVINGTSPTMITEKWKEFFDNKQKAFFYFLIKDFIKALGYTIKENFEVEHIKVNQFFDKEFLGYFLNLFDYTNKFYPYDIFSKNKTNFTDIYPLIRNLLLKIAEEPSSYKDLIENYKENFFTYRDKKLTILYKPLPELNFSTDSNLIIFQTWYYTSLPKEWITYFNDQVTQIWLTSEFAKSIYIKNGIKENKLKVVYYGVDTEHFNPNIKGKLSRNETFKILFSGFFDFESGIYLLIEAFCQAFTANEDVLLILNSETPLEKEDQKQRQKEVQKYIKELNVSDAIKAKILFDYVDEESFSDLANVCDCFAYPYHLEATFINVLRAMSCELPVIITKSPIALEFFNKDTAYFINSQLEESNINRIFDLELKDNYYYFKPDLEHLKKLLRFNYLNKDLVKTKGVYARELVLANFTLENMMNKIESLL